MHHNYENDEIVEGHSIREHVRLTTEAQFCVGAVGCMLIIRNKLLMWWLLVTTLTFAVSPALSTLLVSLHVLLYRAGCVTKCCAAPRDCYVPYELRGLGKCSIQMIRRLPIERGTARALARTE